MHLRTDPQYAATHTAECGTQPSRESRYPLNLLFKSEPNTWDFTTDDYHSNWDVFPTLLLLKQRVKVCTITISFWPDRPVQFLPLERHQTALNSWSALDS